MATVYVTRGKAPAGSPYGNSPIMEAPCASETITSSGTAASGALTGSAGMAVQIFCDTAVYARTDGTASASTGCLVPAGIPVYLALNAGQVVSVIDV